MKREKVRITGLDLRIMAAVACCYLTAVVLKQMGLTFSCGESQLEIIQGMTSCFACLLCCQDTVPMSRKAGINRLIITGIGGLVGVGVVLIDEAVQNPWLMVLLVAVGVLLTMEFCKAAGVPYINARIGGLTFILVACTLPGPARIYYAGFRLLSTLYGVFITISVTWAATKLWPPKEVPKTASAR